MTSTASRRRVLVLWAEPSGYMRACLRSLAAHADVTVYWGRNEANAPYEPVDDQSFVEEMFERSPQRRDVQRLIASTRPNLVLHCGWRSGAYRRLAASRRDVPHVLFFDNPWTGSPAQVLFSVIAPRVLAPRYVGSFVPGPRQARYARRLGFPATRITTGAYSAESDHRVAPPGGREKAFLFIGRLVPEKGIQELRAAYASYRNDVDDPWPLQVFGVGPLRTMLAGMEGVTLNGFAQPTALKSALDQYSCLILPSRSEHWGVVVHEAAIAGMGIICTVNVGASVTLVEDGANGYVLPSRDVGSLAAAMRRMSSHDDETLLVFGEVSRALARRYSPDLWASKLLSFIDVC